MKKTATILKFDFWRDNTIANHFQLTPAQLAEKFTAWIQYQINHNTERGQKWYEYYYGQQLVSCFITDNETIKGLQSVYEPEQWDALYEHLRTFFI